MASFYTFSYGALATNVAPAVLAAAMAAQPIPMDPLNVVGLSVVSDVTTTALPNVVTRTIQLQSSTGPLPDDQIAPMLIDYMGPQLEQALSTIVTSSPVVVT